MSEPASTPIADLMALDPLSLTKEDRSQIIAYYRENRVRFLSGAAQVKTAKAPKGKNAGIELDLGDITL